MSYSANTMKQKVYSFFENYLDGLSSLVFPSFCINCKKELNKNRSHFCFLCEDKLNYTYFEKYKDYSVADQVFWGRLKIENVYALLYYENNSSTKNILHNIKYNEGKDLGRHMGKMMGERLLNSDRFKDIEAIIPIPVHSKKEFSRGYNQSLMIAEGMAESMQLPIVEALYRKSHDKSQTQKNKEERYKNVKGKFAFHENSLNGLKHVMIVDDVLTTGSTLEFATRAIYESENTTKVSLGTIAMAH